MIPGTTVPVSQVLALAMLLFAVGADIVIRLRLKKGSEKEKIIKKSGGVISEEWYRCAVWDVSLLLYIVLLAQRALQKFCRALLLFGFIQKFLLVKTPEIV